MHADSDVRYLRDLNLLITRTCNAACAHCSVESSPTDRRRMDDGVFSAALEFIEAFSKVRGSRRVLVTGGEPYLERRRLLAVVETAHRHGLRAGVETNGYWARDYADGCQLVSKIAFDDYLISASTFHAQFVPTAAVENAWRAAGAAGRIVKVRLSHRDPPTQEDRELHERLGRLIPAEDLLVEPVAPAGRALSTGIALPQPYEPLDDRCPADGMLVDHRGMVHPCCNALSLIEGHALELGQTGAQPAEAILARAQRDALFAALRERGLAWVTTRLNAQGLPTPDLGGRVCDRCHALFAAQHLREALRAER
ncbi:MAG TPA: radical SAM protein [Vicinamibacterales bacterium]|nr:radical SAM protein [Vicinamibacterales bacterium]